VRIYGQNTGRVQYLRPVAGNFKAAGTCLGLVLFVVARCGDAICPLRRK
jgi:hypothetical protein